MSPTPVTFSSPVAPAQYAWEATDEEVALRYGVPVEEIVRFDLNTAPAPPALAAGVLASGRFDRPVSEYPPADYRRLVEAAAQRYGVRTDELLVGAGADEVLDIVAKAWLPPGGAAVVPVPTYAMYRVLTEQRPARVIAVPRRPAEDGWTLDPDAIRAAARAANLVWLCNPNNPTGRPEPEGLLERLLLDLASDAAEDGREPPAVILDEAYAEFSGRSLAGLRAGYPRLVAVRTVSKAYALAGLRVGFAIGRPERIAELAVYRPPGSVAIPSVAVATAALLDPGLPSATVTLVETERARLAAALGAAGWDVGPSATNFLLAKFPSPEVAAMTAEALLRRGLVPRTFGADHPLADHLRITVRSAPENDRLVAVALSTPAGTGAGASSEVER